MYRGLLNLLLFFLVVAVVLSCSTTGVRTQVTRPAEVDMSKFRTVAIFKVENDIGRGHVTDAVREVLIGRPDAFRVVEVDEERVARLMEEQHKSRSEYYSAEGVSQIGQMMQTDAIVTGRINNYGATERNEIIYDEFDLAPDDGLKNYRRRAIVQLDVTLTVTAVKTAQVLAEKTYTRTVEAYSNYYQLQENLPGEQYEAQIPLPNYEPMYKNCSRQIAREFSRVIMSYAEAVDVDLDNIDYHPDAARALTFANDGRWDNAAEAYEKIRDFAKANQAREDIGAEGVASAYYNYGVCLQYLGRYEEALQNLNAAYKANPKSYYNEQIARCKQDQLESGREK